MDDSTETKKTKKMSPLVEAFSIELLRASILILILVGLMNFWFLPKIHYMLDNTNHAKVAVMNVAKITSESRITDSATLIARVKTVRNELIEQGYIVIDATTVLGRSTAYEIPTSMIDKGIKKEKINF